MTAVEPDLIYKSPRIIVGRVGKGQRAMIYEPKSAVALQHRSIKKIKGNTAITSIV